MSPTDLWSVWILLLVGLIGVGTIVRTLTRSSDHMPVSSYHRQGNSDYKCSCNLHLNTRIQLQRHIFNEWLDSKMKCQCDHSKSEHNGMSGPNSNGKWNHAECTFGSKVISPYRLGGCDCRGWRRNWKTIGRKDPLRNDG